MKYLLLLLLVSAGPAFAESETLWVPESMIAGQQYHGMVMTQRASQEGTLAILSTDDTGVLRVQDTVSILPHKNHGIFEITPVSEGTTEISAIVDGRLLREQVEVFSSEMSAVLRVIPAANVTKADSMPVYVVMYDNSGTPIRAIYDTEISLATLGGIRAPASVIIKNDTSWARFEIDTRGSGSIIASSGSLHPYRTDITKLQDDITVRVAVAPDIAMENSYAFYYVWLEKDGRPFRPSGTTDVFMHSSNADMARFDIDPNRQPEDVIHLVDGVAKGILYTGQRGHAAITASIEEYGPATDQLFVGHARFGNIDENDNLTILTNEQDFSEEITGMYEPNLAMLWIYPTITDGPAWGVVATYHANKTRMLEVQLDESGVQYGGIARDALIVPAESYGRTVHIVSSHRGLDHGGAYTMEPHLMRTNAIEFEISGTNHGQYAVTASGPELEPDSAKLLVAPGHSEEYDIAITEIPGMPDVRRDIAVVSIVDGTGAMMDMREIFEHDTEYVISTGPGIHDAHISEEIAGSAIVNGRVSGAGTLTAILDGVDSVTADIGHAGPTASMSVLAPEAVHAGEPFPFAAHAVGPAGTPVYRLDGVRVSSGTEVSVDGGLMTLGAPGTARISFISSVGAATHEIDGFENEMNPYLNLESTDLRVGRDVVLEVTSDVDAAYSLTTGMPFVQTGPDTFVITPDTETGSATITILADRDGYRTVSISETVSVREAYTLDVTATDTDGTKLYMDSEISLPGRGALDARLPYHTETRHGTTYITFPEKVTADGRGYAFERARVNGADASSNHITMELDTDTQVSAIYREEILISVIDGHGSGIYRYGDTVSIAAPDRDVVLFLVRDVFDRWDGIDSESPRETFTATSDMQIVAVYREDYTYLMIIIMAPVLAGSVLVLLRRTAGLGWAVQNVLERIRAVVSDVAEPRGAKSQKAAPKDSASDA